MINRKRLKDVLSASKTHQQSGMRCAVLASMLCMPMTGYSNPEGTYQLRIQTSTPKRTGETIFSSFVAWRHETGRVQKANGLAFIKGTQANKPTTDIEAAHKIASALNGGINYNAPTDRGAKAALSQGKAELMVSNRAGFGLTRLTTRDYTNQNLRYTMPDKSFSGASVGVAIDLVYSAAVEYVDNFSSGVKLETAGGSVTVTIDDNAPIVIETKGKTTKQLENELAKALGASAQFSLLPIYPNFVEFKSRNYKAFDGGEVQLLNLNAKSITIDVNDSGLGILTKFSFPDQYKPEDSAFNMTNIIGLLIVMAGAGVFFYRRKKKMSEESSQ